MWQKYTGWRKIHKTSRPKALAGNTLDFAKWDPKAVAIFTGDTGARAMVTVLSMSHNEGQMLMLHWHDLWWELIKTGWEHTT